MLPPNRRTFVSALLVVALQLPAKSARAEPTSEYTTVGAVGIVASGLGGLALLMGGCYGVALLCNGPRCGDMDVTRAMAIGFSAGGAALLAVGIPMMLLGREETPVATPKAKTANLIATPNGVLVRF